MPCRSYPEDFPEDVSEKTDILSRIACIALQALEDISDGKDTPEQIKSVLSNKEVLEWWPKHKEADMKAQRLREKLAEDKRIRQAALSKLSQKERHLLGL